MSRRKARTIAFQALYSWDVNKSPLEDLLDFSWMERNPGDDAASEENESSDVVVDEDQTFAKIVIAGTIDHIDEIDELIKAHLNSSWTFERVNKVSLAILRVSIYELKFQADAIPGVIIDEAISIAKSFGTDDSYKFINAVLDKIGKNESK